METPMIFNEEDTIFDEEAVLYRRDWLKDRHYVVCEVTHNRWETEDDVSEDVSAHIHIGGDGGNEVSLYYFWDEGSDNNSLADDIGEIDSLISALTETKKEYLRVRDQIVHSDN